MNRTICLFLGILLLMIAPSGRGQQSVTNSRLEKVPRGLSVDDWEKMNRRWQLFSTRLTVLKNDGTTIEGQLTWMSDSLLIIQNNFDFPTGIMNPADYTRIPIRDIRSMNVRIGGHPYQGLIIGLLTGIVPGFVTGAILAQGWTIIPAIVFGAVTAGAGGTAGALIQKAGRKQVVEIKADEWNGRTAERIRKSALFPDRMPQIGANSGEASLPGINEIGQLSPTLSRAFPDNPYAISIQTTLMSNSIRKRLQNWYMSPLWGPPDPYYETRIGLEADLSRRIGSRFQAGLLFQLFPGDISSSFFNKYLPDWNVNFSYNHHFKQTTYGIYGGWLMQPASRYRTSGLEASVQAGLVVSDIYEHFYLNWNSITGDGMGETFVRHHNYQPGAMLRLKTSWYLIPGFSIDAGLEGFLIRRVLFNERTVLPLTAYGPESITRHTLNFSNIQGFIGLTAHF